MINDMSGDNVTSKDGRDNNNVCAVCKIVAKQACSACKNIYYCSREHQISDWKSHSKTCRRLFKLIEDSTIGRYNVSTRNIKVDELIMTENKSILVTPVLGMDPVCLNCYVPLKIYKSKPCNHCGWPLCLECTRHGPECELTIRYKKSKVTINDYTDTNTEYAAVIVMRAIALRENNPNDFKKLLNLWDALNECAKDMTALMIYHVAANDVMELIKIHDMNIMEMVTIIAIVALRGFGVETPSNNLYFAIFDKPSFNAHDCRANSRLNTYYDATNGARIVIRAVSPIEKGQPITLSFAEPLLGTVRRRGSLMGSKFLKCACKRCTDPTDLGTMYSAIRCFKTGCTGYMLPSTFLVSEDEKIPNFVCCICGSAIPSDTIGRITEYISNKFSKIDQKNVNELRNFIAAQSKILHENHFHIVNAELKLAEIFHNHNEEFMPEELTKEILTMCKKLTTLISTLAPDEYSLRGMVLYAQYTCMMLVCSKLPTAPEKIRMFKESTGILKESYRLLRYVNNGEMAERARIQLTGIETGRCIFGVFQTIVGTSSIF